MVDDLREPVGMSSAGLDIVWTITEAAPPMPAQYCHKCGALTPSPVLVREVHAASGPGRNVYACPAHAPRRPVTFTPAAALAESLRRGRLG
ncbi:hypothetical protein AB0M39_33980 [Streptomyces sp. NPDC051907]|uniref:hypothetical protein n=1 Tax=Streptomyces sp. NPDC051907 TaxID=3155284 RepID=UPI00342C5BB6